MQELSDFSYCKEVLTIAVIDRSKEVREAASILLKNFIKESGLIEIANILEIKQNDLKKQREILQGYKYICEAIAT